MKRKVNRMAGLICAAALTAGLAGCETMKKNPVATGAAAGAAAGVVGGAVADQDNRWRGAAIGGAGGAAIGAGAGYIYKKNKD